MAYAVFTMLYQILPNFHKLAYAMSKIGICHPKFAYATCSGVKFAYTTFFNGYDMILGMAYEDYGINMFFVKNLQMPWFFIKLSSNNIKKF